MSSVPIAYIYTIEKMRVCLSLDSRIRRYKSAVPESGNKQMEHSMRNSYKKRAEFRRDCPGWAVALRGIR